jgi:hypothetical protein
MSETLEEEEVCLIRIKSARRGAQYADCLLKNTTKHNKYDVNQQHDHADDISFREHFGRISVFFSK